MMTPIEQHNRQTSSGIHLTREDGTRIHLSAEQIVYTEPTTGGTLVHLASGELVRVVQDTRTVDLRVTVALSPPPPPQEPPPHEDASPIDMAQHESLNAKELHRPEPATLNRRAKRLLLGRSSLPVLMIGRASRRREGK
ncbi:hypothetical protein [Sphingomonas oryzagri]